MKLRLTLTDSMLAIAGILAVVGYGGYAYGINRVNTAVVYDCLDDRTHVSDPCIVTRGTDFILLHMPTGDTDSDSSLDWAIPFCSDVRSGIPCLNGHDEIKYFPIK